MFCVVICSVLLVSSGNTSSETSKTNNKSNAEQLSANSKKSITDAAKLMYSPKSNENLSEVQKYVNLLWTTADKIPDDVKSRYSGDIAGTPLFIRDERDPSIDVIVDYYLVPLLKDNKIVGGCMVTDRNNNLGFGMVGDVSDASNSLFRTDINKLLDKVRTEKGIEIIRFELVHKPDYKNKAGLNPWDPQIKITAADGEIFYYSGKGMILSKEEMDINSSTEAITELGD